MKLDNSKITEKEWKIINLAQKGLDNRAISFRIFSNGCHTREISNTLTIIFKKTGATKRDHLKMLEKPESFYVCDLNLHREQNVLVKPASPSLSVKCTSFDGQPVQPISDAQWPGIVNDFMHFFLETKGYTTPQERSALIRESIKSIWSPALPATKITETFYSSRRTRRLFNEIRLKREYRPDVINDIGQFFLATQGCTTSEEKKAFIRQHLANIQSTAPEQNL